MMNVDVIQVKDAEFKRFSWWSDWVDVAVFDCNSTPFLLQMSVNRFNKKRFNAIRMTGSIAYRQSTCYEIGDLVQMERKK